MTKQYGVIFVDAKRFDKRFEFRAKNHTAVETVESAFKKAMKLADSEHYVEIMKECYETGKDGINTFWGELYAVVKKSKTKGVYAVQTYTVKGKPSYKYDLLSNGTLINRRR